tara:strand:- start:374 stop:670 length:297 start_codon:yes stop_codon:yes gene_type:complete
MSESQFEKLLKTLNTKDDEIERLRAEIERLMNAMESAWGLIANAEHLVGHQVIGWQSAFQQWRDEEWHPALDRNKPATDRETGLSCKVSQGKKEVGDE